MNRQRTALLAAAMAALLISPACVMKSTHEALQNEYAETKKNLEDKNQELENGLANLKKEKADIEKKKADLENEVKALQAALARVLSEKSEIESDVASLESEKASLKSANATLESAKADLESAKADLESDMQALSTDKATLEASLDEMKAALADLARRKAEADARIAEFKSLIARFQSLIDAGKLKVKIIDGRMVVVLASDVLFPPGSAKLSKKGQEDIAEVAVLLSGIPDRKFQIEGHTDNVAIKTAVFPSNWELASARAITVLKLMIDNGMDVDRISAASFGDSKPVGDNETTEGRAANRRIEIVVTPDLSTLPGFDELNKVAGGDVR